MTPTTGNGVRERKGSRKAELVLGEDWLAADGLVDSELKAGRERRGPWPKLPAVLRTSAKNRSE